MGLNYHIPKPEYARFTVRYVASTGYFVYSPSGQRIAGPYKSKDSAQTSCESYQARHDARLKRGPRACMSCTRQFDSEGIHNRLCPACRGAGSDTALYRVIRPSSRG